MPHPKPKVWCGELAGTSCYPRSLKKEEDSGRKHVLMLRTGVEDEKQALVSYPVRKRVWNEDLNWRNVQRLVGKPYKRSLKKPARTCFCLVFGEKKNGRRFDRRESNSINTEMERKSTVQGGSREQEMDKKWCKMDETQQGHIYAQSAISMQQ